MRLVELFAALAASFSVKSLNTDRAALPLDKQGAFVNACHTCLDDACSSLQPFLVHAAVEVPSARARALPLTFGSHMRGKSSDFHTLTHPEHKTEAPLPKQNWVMSDHNNSGHEF